MTRQKSKGSSSTEENLNCKSACFTEEDRKQLKEINVLFKKLIEEVNELKSKLAMNKRILEETKEENQRLKQQLSLSLYKSDSLEQYGRRENLRIYNVPESANKKDDGEDIIIEIAKLLNVDLKDLDIQRAHWLGQKRIGKTRPIIVRFVSFKKRLELLKLKKKLKTITTDVKNEDPSIKKLKNAFIAEDLTSLRAKLLRYVKEECDG